jgi:hypothetical protein
MGIDPSTFILNQQAFGLSYAGWATGMIANLSHGLGVYSSSSIPAPNIGSSTFATYVAPDADDSPYPVYDEPLITMPIVPLLADTNAIPVPIFPASPAEQVSSTIDGLFNQPVPSKNLPTWDYTIPDTQADQLVAEMDAIALPTIMSISFPTLSALDLSDIPVIQLPSFDQPQAPNIPDDPTDYVALTKSTYDLSKVDMQGFINDEVAKWIATYGPELQSMSVLLAQRVQDGMNETIFPDLIEAQMITRARSRTEREFDSIDQDLQSTFQKNGFIEPPGAVLSARLTTRLKQGDALANQSTDIYIERRKMEVQHLQFVMGLAQNNIASLRGLAMQWGQVVNGTVQNAITYSTLIGSMAQKLYEHLIAKADLIIAIMAELRLQYEVRLKAALSVLDGFKIELEAKRLIKDVEMDQVQIIAEQFKTQELEVSRYTAIIEAISHKAAIEQLKLQTLDAEARILDTKVRLQIAGFDVYKAELAADQSKLEGVLGLEKLYTSELEAIKTEIDANIQSNQAIIATNNARVEMFDAQAKAFNLSLDTAIKRFTIGAEVKKLAQTVHMNNVDASVKVYDATLHGHEVTINAIMQQYEGDLKNLDINTRAALGFLESNSRIYQAIGQASADLAGHVVSAGVSLATSVISQ